MERKSLKDISWQVTEEVYREDASLSYSTLATYERSGFNGLEQLYDRYGGIIANRIEEYKNK